MPGCLCDLFLYILCLAWVWHTVGPPHMGGFNSQESLTSMKSLALELSRSLKLGPSLNEGCSLLDLNCEVWFEANSPTCRKITAAAGTWCFFPPLSPALGLYIELNILVDLDESIFTRAGGIKKAGLGNWNSLSWVEKLLKVRSQPWTCSGWNFPGYSYLHWDSKAPA